VGGEPGGTSASIHGLGHLFSALRREGLIADELVLQLATFLGSLDLFLELTVRTVPRTLTTNRFGVAASRAQMVPSFRTFIPVSSIHGTNGGDRSFGRRPIYELTALGLRATPRIAAYSNPLQVRISPIK
jgi:hypothetical protein